jgi:DHA1 family bicyclomycin/chloramphenicol resistance-like MFS transporter
MFGICASGMVMASQSNAWLMRRLGPETQIKWVGLGAIGAAGFLTLTVLLHLASVPVMAFGAFLLFAAQGISMTPASVTALDTQGANAGAAAALMGALQLATGSAISGAVSALFPPESIVLVGTQLG